MAQGRRAEWQEGRRSVLRLSLSAFLTSCLSALPASVSAQEPSLATVLARAGVYVLDFQRQLSGIVAEETYVQDVRPMRSFMPGTSTNAHRVLKSDLLLVKPVGADRWIQFRDVFEVDGKPVHDRNERLMKLFLEPSASTATQVQRIVEESFRYNIGNLSRTVNVPVLALVVLSPQSQSRFNFKRAGQTSGPDAAWIVEYREVEPQTMIRTNDDHDMPSRGRFWIEPETGRVRRSELIAENLTIGGLIDVTYQLDSGVGLLVPAEMRERYELRRDNSRVIGTATYGRFRQFQVKVDEKIAPIKEK